MGRGVGGGGGGGGGGGVVGHEDAEVAVDDFLNGVAGEGALVELEEGDEEGEFDVGFFGGDGLEGAEDLEGFTLGVFVVLEIAIGGRGHGQSAGGGAGGVKGEAEEIWANGKDSGLRIGDRG